MLSQRFTAAFALLASIQANILIALSTTDILREEVADDSPIDFKNMMTSAWSSDPDHIATMMRVQPVHSPAKALDERWSQVD